MQRSASRRFVVVGVLCALLALGVFARARHAPARMAQPAAQPAAKAPPAPPPKPQRQPGAAYSAVVLCYHRIANAPAQATVLAPASFIAQLEYLKTHGYQVIKLSELVDALTNDGVLPGNAVVLTFDDGFASDYHELFPILQRYGYPATLFVYTNWVGKARGADTWEQLTEMTASGLIEVESHTLSHANLVRKSAERRQTELTEAKAVIEAKLGNQVTSLAYPYGAHSPAVIAAAKAAGYRAAFVVNGREVNSDDDPFKLGRCMIFRRDSLDVFAGRVGARALSLDSRSPLPGAEVGEARPTVTAQLATGIDPTKVALRLDGQLLAASWDGATRTLRGQSAAPLSNRVHTAQVSAVSAGGVALRRSWTFKVAAAPVARPSRP